MKKLCYLLCVFYKVLYLSLAIITFSLVGIETYYVMAFTPLLLLLCFVPLRIFQNYFGNKIKVFLPLDALFVATMVIAILLKNQWICYINVLIILVELVLELKDMKRDMDISPHKYHSFVVIFINLMYGVLISFFYNLCNISIYFSLCTLFGLMAAYEIYLIFYLVKIKNEKIYNTLNCSKYVAYIFAFASIIPLIVSVVFKDEDFSLSIEFMIYSGILMIFPYGLCYYLMRDYKQNDDLDE